MSLKKYVRGCVSLKKQKSQGKAVEDTVNSKENSLKTFNWILSRNSASGKELISKNRKPIPIPRCRDYIDIPPPPSREVNIHFLFLLHQKLMRKQRRYSTVIAFSSLFKGNYTKKYKIGATAIFRLFSGMANDSYQPFYLYQNNRCDIFLKKSKHEIFDSRIFMQSKPVWIGDLKTSQKIKIVMFQA